MATYADDRIGKTIYADNIKLLKLKERRSPYISAQRAGLKLLNVDYSAIVGKIEKIEADNIITPQEKTALTLQWESLNALRLNTIAKAEQFGIEEQELYLSYIEAYEDLDELISFILDPLTLDEDTDISDKPSLSSLFKDYYDKAILVDEQLFRLETGMLNGLDYRVKLEVNIIASHNPLLLDGSSSTLSVKVLENGVDKTETYENSNFSWFRITEDAESDIIWNGVGRTGKSITVDKDDLVSRNASIGCEFHFNYAETMYISKTGFISLFEEPPAGEKGDTGPSGTLGKLGAYIKDGDLILSGFDEGEAIGDGYLYFGDTRITIPYTEIELTGTGKGYIGYDDDLVLLKILPETGYVDWRDYNTMESVYPSIIFGEFNNSTVDIFDAIDVTNFLRQHFMGLLKEVADGIDISTEQGINSINLWASALGVNQVFGSITVLEAFIDYFIARKVEIMKGGYVTSTDFKVDNNGIPIKGFSLDTEEVIEGGQAVSKGRVRATNMTAFDSLFINSTIDGDIINPSLETKRAISSGSLIKIPPKSAFPVTTLYGLLEAGGTKNVSGTGSDSKTIVNYIKQASSGKFITASHSFYHDGWANTKSQSFYAPAMTTEVYVNGWTGGMYCWISAYMVVDGISTKLFSGAFAGDARGIATVDIPEGGRIDLFAEAGIFGGIGSISVEFRTKAQYKAGILFEYSDNSVENLLHNSYSESPIELVSPAFDYTDYNKYAPIDNFISAVSSLPNGVLFLVDQSVSKITYGNSTNEPIIAVKRLSDQIEIRIDGDAYVFAPRDSDDTQGWYELEGQFELFAQEEGIETKTIIPKNNLNNIGSANKRFLTAFLEYVNTGDGDFKIGQNLRPTDDVSFNELDAKLLLHNVIFDEGQTFNKYVINAQPGGKIAQEHNTVMSTSSSAWVKIKEMISTVSGTATVRFELDGSSGSPDYYNGQARVYINDVAVGSITGATNGYSWASANFNIAIGDKVQIYGRKNTYYYVRIRGFNISTLGGIDW